MMYCCSMLLHRYYIIFLYPIKQVATSLIPGQWCSAEFWKHCFSLKHRKHCCSDSVRGPLNTVLLPLGVREDTTRRLIFSQLLEPPNSIAVDVCSVQTSPDWKIKLKKNTASTIADLPPPLFASVHIGLIGKVDFAMNVLATVINSSPSAESPLNFMKKSGRDGHFLRFIWVQHI